MSFRQQVKTVTHVVELLNFEQDRIRMHGVKAAGVAVRPPSGWGRGAPKPANEVITDSGPEKPAIPVIPAYTLRRSSDTVRLR